MQLKFQVTMYPQSDDAILGRVKNIVPQAENIRVVSKTEKAALVGFRKPDKPAVYQGSICRGLSPAGRQV